MLSVVLGSGFVMLGVASILCVIACGQEEKRIEELGNTVENDMNSLREFLKRTGMEE